MHILILGGGVIGMTAAYVLGARGHRVELVERNQACGEETSHANGGQLSFSHAEPWANPTVLPKIAQWMFQKDAPLIFRPRADWDMITWGLSFLRNCFGTRYQQTSLDILRLGLYSKRKQALIDQETRIEYDHLTTGILHIFTNKISFDHAMEQAKLLDMHGCRHEFLDASACLAKEPALANARRKIVGGILAVLDESGDAFKFTQSLAKHCEEKLDFTLHCGTKIERIEMQGGRVTGVVTDKGILQADAYVMSLGSYSPIYLKPIGIRVPIYPMKGYSITMPASAATPTISITDAELKLVYSRLGNRLRVAGTAEFAGYDTSIREDRVAPILRAARELFPGCDSSGQVANWACLRPSTPDGPPIIGKTQYSNFYLNTGHGTLGWTQAAGSAYLLADILENRQPEITMHGLTLDRYL